MGLFAVRRCSEPSTGLRSALVCSGVALAATGLALLLWLCLGSLIAPSPFPLLLVGVMVSAWYGGLLPGLLATLASGLILDYFFEGPPLDLAVSSPQTVAQLLGFALLALLVSGLQLNLRDTRRRAEVAQRRLRDMVHDAGAIVWEQQPETLQFTFVTQPAEGLLGYPVARWTAEPEFWATLLHPADRARVEAACRAAIGDRRDYELEYRAIAADGRVVWLRHIGHMIPGGASRVLQVRGVLVDITARKQAELEREQAYRQLELERGRLEGVLRQLPAGVIIAEAPSGRIVLSNAQVERILTRRCQPSSTIADYGQGQFFAVDGSPLRPQDTPLARALRDGEVVIAEDVEVAGDDRTRRAIRVSAAPVYDRQGHIIAGVATLHDVSEQKRAAAAEHFLLDASRQLASSLEYEATLARVAHLAVPMLATWCVVDLVGPDEVLRQVAVAHADPPGAEALGELRRRPAFNLGLLQGVANVVRSGRPELIADVDAWLASGASIGSERRALLRQLAVRSYMIVPLLGRGRAIGAISLVRGESAAVYSAEDLALAEALASRCALAIDNARLYQETAQAVRVRDEFLAAASHELRTPLAHIKGFVSTLRQTDVEWDESTRQDFLGEVEQEADRLGKLIGDLLDITRIESGGLEPTARAWTAPAAIVAGGLSRVRGLVANRPLAVDVEPDLPLVRVDASQLERVIGNLVENATKFSPPGCPIRIVATRADDAVQLWVEDAGPGIPTEHLQHIFERFFRVRSDRAPVPGTGLGLAICRGLVEAHGGRVWAENRPGGGARFVVSLPASTDPQDQPA